MLRCVGQILAVSVPAGRVYIALACRVDQSTGIVGASYERIAVDGEMSRRQAGEGVAKLLEMGYLELVTKGRQHVPNVYRMRVTRRADAGYGAPPEGVRRPIGTGRRA